MRATPLEHPVSRKRLASAGATVLFGVLTVLCLILAYAPAVEARYVHNLRGVYFDNGRDGLWNYDFNSRYPSSSNVDWPVTVHMYGMPGWFNTDEVRIAFDHRFTKPVSSCDTWCKFMEMNNDGSSWFWDATGGRATHWPDAAFGCVNNTARYHYRDYSPQDNHWYSPQYGRSIVATTHRDVHDGCSGSQHGWSELVEDDFARVARESGFAVYQDYAAWGNYNWYGWTSDGRYYREGDGLVTLVRRY